MSLPERFDKERHAKLDSGTQLALRRTLLAHQRSLMAWIRTSASLIGFGFTTYKFFEYFAKIGAIEHPTPHILGVRHFGMGLILIGVIANVLATIDYHRQVRELEAEWGPLRKPMGEVISALVGFAGLALFIVVFLRG